MKLFCDRSAPDNLSPFEDQRLVAALGKIERRDKPIVPAADYEDALSSGHGQFFEWNCREGAVFRQSRRITWLAIRPGAPIIPPPGWVAAPHI